MNDELYNNKYRINSIRVPWHNYSGGIYFITICTKDRVHYFGEISRDWTYPAPTTVYENIIHYTKLGTYLNDCIKNITSHCPYAEIPLWQVMPNHVHLIVLINPKKVPYERRTNESINNLRQFCAPSRDGACPVSTPPQFHISTPNSITTPPQFPDLSTKMQMTDATKGWLSVCIGSIKCAITSFANKNNIPFAWQTKFHEHIIKSHDDLNKITEYICGNVDNWESDCFYHL